MLNKNILKVLGLSNTVIVLLLIGIIVGLIAYLNINTFNFFCQYAHLFLKHERKKRNTNCFVFLNREKIAFLLKLENNRK